MSAERRVGRIRCNGTAAYERHCMNCGKDYGPGACSICPHVLAENCQREACTDLGREVMAFGAELEADVIAKLRPHGES